ncbi:hypothetical protein C8R46DRAFT_1059648 [Mycena filopes]|nr:hypothetical protein C8R46DRAFT_1059648 [Mycena filopes]
MRTLWPFLTVFTLAVNAALTNHTVDDASPQIIYNQPCANCQPAEMLGFDTSRLNGGTVTTLSGLTVVPTGLQFKFTGTSIYIFIAIPAFGIAFAENPTNQPGDSTAFPYPASRFPEGDGYITLDGQASNGSFPIGDHAQYSYCVWSTTGLVDGPHSLKFETSGSTVDSGGNLVHYGTAIMLDSIVYTSNDSPEPSPSDTVPPTVGVTSTVTVGTASSSDTAASTVGKAGSASAIPSGVSHTASSGSATPSGVLDTASSASASPSGVLHAAVASGAKRPVGAIVGGVVGGIALILALAGGCMLSRQAKRGGGQTPQMMEESAPRQNDPLLTRSPSVPVIAVTNTGPAWQDPMAAERLRLLEEEVHQMRQSRAGSSNARSSVTDSDASLGRSLSTMKREQTRALAVHGEGGESVRDTLLHTDSGLRLSAGRMVDELPPTYIAD